MSLMQLLLTIYTVSEVYEKYIMYHVHVTQWRARQQQQMCNE